MNQGITLQTSIDAPTETFPFEQKRTGRSNSRSANDGFKPYPVDTSVALAGLLDRFKRDQKPTPISFRQVVPWLKIGERASHYLHSYPAKLLPHIAHFFLANRSLIGEDEVVLDPFCGSGTVALETILSGRPALYADANPLGRLITAVKTRPIDPASLAVASTAVREVFRRSRACKLPDVVNLEKWFDPGITLDLVRLRAAIGALGSKPNKALDESTNH